MGPDGNTFDETPEQCHQLRLRGPIIDNRDLAKIRAVREGVFDPATLSLLWPVGDLSGWLPRALDRVCRAAVQAIDDGHNVLILSDRGVGPRHVAIPALLALGAVQAHLVREGIRMQVGLVVETGEAREVHDIALLVGYGAAAVNPYLALDTARAIAGEPGEVSYIHALEDGLLKVMSKSGISTVQSYRGAQIFEAVGQIATSSINTSPARRRGSPASGIAELADEVLARHARIADDALPVAGQYRWRRTGERHKWNPQTIAALQDAVRRRDRARFDEFERLCDDEERALVTLRGLLAIDPARSRRSRSTTSSRRARSRSGS